MITFYLYDRWGAQLDTLTGVLSAVHKDELNGEDSLTIEVLDRELEKGQRIVWRDKFRQWHEHIVNDLDEMHADGKLITNAYCVNSIAELLTDYIEDKRPTGQASAVLQRALEGTRWTVGTVTQAGTNSTNWYHESVYEAIKDIVEVWGGELSTTLELSGSLITARKVNIEARRGKDVGQLFTYGRNLVSVSREVDPQEVYTALYGYGKGVEMYDESGNLTGGYSRKITFGEINGGLDWIGNDTARLKWGLPNGKGGIKHTFGKVEFSECEDPKELLALTRIALEETCKPRVTYTGTVAALAEGGLLNGEDTQTGDSVYIRDKVINLRLEGRAVCVQRDLLDERNTVITLGNLSRKFTDKQKGIENKLGWLADHASSWDSAAGLSQSFVNAVINNWNEQINADGGYVYWEQGDGIIVYDRDVNNNPTKAIQFKGGAFRIANSKLPNGDWNWRTFGTGDGFTADVINAGEIRGGANYWNLETGDLEFNQGGIRDSKGHNYWNLDTGEFRLSVDAAFNDTTIGQMFHSIESEMGDLDLAIDSVDKGLKDVVEDGIVTEAEAAAVAKLLQRVQTEQLEAISAYNEAYNNRYLSPSYKTTLLNAKNALYGSDNKSGVYGTLITRVNQVIDCKTKAALTTAMTNYKNAYNSYQSNRKTFADALNAAKQNINDNYTDKAIEDVIDDINKELADVDTSISALDKDLRKAISDSVITETEAASLSTMLKRLETERVEAISAYNLVYSNSNLTNANLKSALLNAKNDLYGTDGNSGKCGTLVSKINAVISSKTADAVNKAMAEYETAYKAYQTSRDTFTKAVRNAENNIVDGASKTAAKTEIDAQTQESIFKKLTNGGTNQGVYLDKGVLYINASYIKAGIITDGRANNPNKWDLKNGTFTTYGMKANNIEATGTFVGGSITSTTGYGVRINTLGRIEGFWHGKLVTDIDPSHVMNNNTIFGLSLWGTNYLRLVAPNIYVAQNSNKNAYSTTANSETVTPIPYRLTGGANGSLSWRDVKLMHTMGFFMGWNNA